MMKCIKTGCGEIHLLCECICKVEKREFSFLFDQRSSREMFIGIDPHISNKLLKIERRTVALEKRRENEEIMKIKEERGEVESHEYSLSEDLDLYNDVEDMEPFAKPYLPNAFSFRNTQPIPNIAIAADRYGVSNRDTAALIDFGLITPEERSLVTDKNKVARAREKYLRQLQMEERMETNDIFGIYFDGRHDSTLSKVEIKGKWHPKTIMEEHYVVICQNGTYLFYTSPESGYGIQIASSMYANLEKLVGCDGSNVNVSWKNGTIVNLEKKFEENYSALFVSYLLLNCLSDIFLNISMEKLADQYLLVDQMVNCLKRSYYTCL